MPITFKVDDVRGRYRAEVSEYSSSAKYHAHYFGQELSRVGIKSGSVEAHKFNAEKVQLHNPSTSAFLKTAMMAYNSHAPIAFAPEDIWIMILQAVTKHIELNPEDARKAIVSFDGKKTLSVEAKGFVKGSKDNDWESVFAGFASQVEEYLGKKKDLFDAYFSTTTPTEQAAIRVQMMAALAPYFDYKCYTMCGVPTVTLLGDSEDWELIYRRVLAFGEFYPKWAHEPLMIAVTNFKDAARGLPDMRFWKNFFKTSGGSGGTPINGWCTVFYPYVENKPNKMMLDKMSYVDVVEGSPYQGYDLGDYGGSVSGVPLEWNYYGDVLNMRLATGLFGSTIKDGEYRNVIGWVVGEAK